VGGFVQMRYLTEGREKETQLALDLLLSAKERTARVHEEQLDLCVCRDRIIIGQRVSHVTLFTVLGLGSEPGHRRNAKSLDPALGIQRM
jgi:hypothetical protein